MNPQSNTFLPSVESLRHCVADSIATGIGDRIAASQSRQSLETHLSSQSRLAAEQEIRAAAIAGGIPLKVRRAVSASMSWDKEVRVAVMELTSEEYPGPFYRMPSVAPEPELDSAKLAYAALAIWKYLIASGFSPKLKYIMDDDIRRYKLAIVIDVQCIR